MASLRFWNVAFLVTALLAVTSSAFAAGGAMDLGVGNLVVQGGASPPTTGTPYLTVYNMVLSGFNGGGWDGTAGITSSAAAANVGVTALATVKNDIGGGTIWATGSDLGPEFASVGALGVNDTIVKYTYYGDADLNGVVDPADQTLLDLGFGSSDGWLWGDFDYNGVVDPADQTLLDLNFGTPLGGPLGASVSAVPEPASWFMIAAAIVGLLFATRVRR